VVSGNDISESSTNDGLELDEEPVFFPSSSPSENVPSQPKKKQKTESKQKTKVEQMCIDVGQKNFGSITCDECGMLYLAMD
jgi:hypothetical protein